MRILLTCGIGDFIAIDSHLTQEERESVTAIHWATRAREAIQSIAHHSFPNLKEHVIERDNWGAPFTADFCVSSRDELPKLPADVVDWNVSKITDEIRAGTRQYRGSTYVHRDLVGPEQLLAYNYMVVHPYSDNARTFERDFTGAEWYEVQRYARERDWKIVLVNKGKDTMPLQFAGVIDLSNKLTVEQTIEVTKGAIAFAGCASFPAIIAAKTLPANRLFIKANHSVKKHFFWFYYAPHDTNNFVTDHDIREIL